MTLLRWLLYGLLPAVAAVLLFVGAAGPRYAAAGLAAGIVVPYGLLVAWPDWPWQLGTGAGTAMPWLFWSIAAAGLTGLLHDVRLLPRPLTIVCEAALVVWLPWALAAPLRRHWSFEAGLLHLGAAWCGLLLVWWALRGASERRPGMLVPLGACLCLGGDLWLVLAREHDLSWQLLAAGIAALATALLTATWRRPFQLGSGATLVLVLLHGGVLFACRVYANLPRQPLLLALLAPLPLWIAAHKAFDESRRTGACIGLAATAAMTAAAAGLW